MPLEPSPALVLLLLLLLLPFPLSLFHFLLGDLTNLAAAFRDAGFVLPAVDVVFLLDLSHNHQASSPKPYRTETGPGLLKQCKTLDSLSNVVTQ